MLDTNNLGELEQPQEDADYPKVPNKINNPIERLANKWRQKAVRYGSKDAGILQDPIDMAANDRPTGDPFGPTAPAASITGYSTGGRHPGRDANIEEDKIDPKTGLRMEKPATPFPYYEPDDETVIWRFMFGRRP
jgi:hypothetical protein